MLIVKELSWHILDHKVIKDLLFLVFEFFWPIKIQKAVQYNNGEEAVM